MPRVTLPASVRVGSLTYAVTENDAVFLQIEQAADMGTLCGHTDHLLGHIHIRSVMGPGQRRETLMHETLHTVMWASGFAHELGGADEEKIVRRVAPVLLTILRDNPGLVKYLTAES